MTTHKVLLDSDAYLVCLQHALSTEKEEIMGLLIGEVIFDNICIIAHVDLRKLFFFLFRTVITGEGS